MEVYLLTPADIITNKDITDEQKRIKVTSLMIRACSNGDIGKVRDFLGFTESTSSSKHSSSVAAEKSPESLSSSIMKKGWKEWIDLNMKDEDGTTALIYAACWGYVDIIEILLEAGCNVDERDKRKWSPSFYSGWLMNHAWGCMYDGGVKNW
jgi:hypothetical protein